MATPKRRKKKVGQPKVVPLTVDFIKLSEDHYEYSKADFVRVCRLADDFAVSFFQVNYQNFVDQITLMKETGEEPKVITTPVSKVVMNRGTFKRLTNDLLSIADKVGISIEEIRKSGEEPIG